MTFSRGSDQRRRTSIPSAQPSPVEAPQKRSPPSRVSDGVADTVGSAAPASRAADNSSKTSEEPHSRRFGHGAWTQRDVESDRSAGLVGYEIVFNTADGVVATLGPCVLIIHSKTATTSILSAMGRAYATAAETWERIAHLCIITPESGMLPPGEVREALQRLMMRFDKRLAAAAIVYEGTGFKATAVRSIVTGLCMVARTTHPTRVFTREGEACLWVAQALALPALLARSELCDAMKELRRHQARSG
jgi:hypothetical protein